MRFYHPNISLSTVYNTLKTFSEKGIIKKILTSEDKIRFDPIPKKHHHIYYPDSEKIEDFEDKELDKILKDYFKKKKISGFKIEDITIQLSGKSTSTQQTENTNPDN
jgi:Fur family peroxide stress response transcriptional regulator